MSIDKNSYNINTENEKMILNFRKKLLITQIKSAVILKNKNTPDE